MASSKRPRRDENTSFSFVDQSAPSTKRPRLKAQPVTLAEIKNLQQERAQKDQAAAEVGARAEAKARVEQVLGSITTAGYETLYGFVDELLNIRDQQLSSRVSNMLGQHGEAILNSIRARQPDLVKKWAVSISGELLAEEGRQLAKYLRPGENQTTSELLQQFSLERIMTEAEHIAPTLCQLLRQIAIKERPEEKDKVRKDRSLASSKLFISC
jgi:hypothetical protein